MVNKRKKLQEGSGPRQAEDSEQGRQHCDGPPGLPYVQTMATSEAGV